MVDSKTQNPEIQDRTCGDCLYWHNTDDPDESCENSPCVDVWDIADGYCFVAKEVTV